MKSAGIAIAVAAFLLLAIAFVVTGATLIGSIQMALNPAGEAYELNLDGASNLIITDGAVGEIWQVPSATSVTTYTVYHGAYGAVDAHADSAGNLWWVDYGSVVGRFDITSDEITLWTFTIPGSTTLSGLTIDDSDRVWAVNLFPDGDFPQVLYRIDLPIREVCTYTFSSRSEYVFHDAGDIWMGDWANDRIGKLDPVSDQYTYWQLPVSYNSWPGGMVMDASGQLWWADHDSGTDALASLDPATDLFTAYDLPVGADPQMVAVNGGSVWYTEQISGTVGRLDPAVATGITVTLTTVTSTVTPICDTLGNGVTSQSSRSTASSSWSGFELTVLMEADGWEVFDLPPGGSPWGIAHKFGATWVVDQGRQQLLAIAQESPTATPSATPTPTNTPTNTPTSTPTNTPTNTPTSIPTSTPTNTPTNTPTLTPTPEPSYDVFLPLLMNG